MIAFFTILVLWLISLCLHEYAHARVAYAGGDHTVAEKGYLTLNPLRYVHPVFSIVVPLLLLALGGVPLPGGAVWIETGRLRSRAWLSAVSAAGPLANLALAILSALPFTLGLVDPQETFWALLAMFSMLQMLAFLLNALPIPPLDGFGALEPWLPADLQRAIAPFRGYGIVLLLVLFLGSPRFHDLIFGGALWLPLTLGVPVEAISDGWQAFWEGRPWAR